MKHLNTRSTVRIIPEAIILLLSKECEKKTHFCVTDRNSFREKGVPVRQRGPGAQSEIK
jgi:hypothetical protein